MNDSEQHAVHLYSYWASSCSWRVRIALSFKGIPFEYKAVNIVKGEQFTEEFKELNPFGTVPVLVDNGFILADSYAILEYLEEKYPQPSLFPHDIKKKALVRQVVNHIVSSIQPLQNLSVLKKVESMAGAEERAKWAQYYIENGFSGLEKLLHGHAGKYCFGDDFTMADVVLVPQLRNAARFQVDMSKFPTLKRIGEALNSLPHIESNSPEKQPDAPA